MPGDSGLPLKIPHMGWSGWSRCGRILSGKVSEDGSRFYFVHSYYVVPEDDSLVAGVTEYGIRFASVLARDNLFAVQFHPEKSADDGLRLLKNFVGWNP